MRRWLLVTAIALLATTILGVIALLFFKFTTVTPTHIYALAGTCILSGVAFLLSGIFVKSDLPEDDFGE